MSNNRYEVRRDFLPIRTSLESISAELATAVEEALRVLELDPRPERYECRRVKGSYFKILVTSDEEDVAIIYEIHDSPAFAIDLINIKRVGAVIRALKLLGDLVDFRP